MFHKGQDLQSKLGEVFWAKRLVHLTPDHADCVRALGHCEVFLEKILYTHSASLHPGVRMLTPHLANLMQWTIIPSTKEGVEVLLETSFKWKPEITGGLMGC